MGGVLENVRVIFVYRTVLKIVSGQTNAGDYSHRALVSETLFF